MGASRRVILTWESPGGEEVEVEFSCTPGMKGPYWDRGHGMWLPPDPSEVELVAVRDEKGEREDIAESKEFQKALDGLMELALEDMEQNDRDAKKDAAEADAEDRRDRMRWGDL